MVLSPCGLGVGGPPTHRRCPAHDPHCRATHHPPTHSVPASIPDRVGSALQPVGWWPPSRGSHWPIRWALLDEPDGKCRCAIVHLRQSMLDELERRDANGFGRWLKAGARAGSDPGRYLNPDP
jgi:hypothetical protein